VRVHHIALAFLLASGLVVSENNIAQAAPLTLTSGLSPELEVSVDVGAGLTVPSGATASFFRIGLRVGGQEASSSAYKICSSRGDTDVDCAKIQVLIERAGEKREVQIAPQTDTDTTGRWVTGLGYRILLADFGVPGSTVQNGVQSGDKLTIRFPAGAWDVPAGNITLEVRIDHILTTGINGVAQNYTVGSITTVNRNEIPLDANGGAEANPSAGESPKAAPSTAAPAIALTPLFSVGDNACGSQIRTNGEGLQSGSARSLVHTSSASTTLDSGTIAGSAFESTVSLPNTLAPGSHTLTLSAVGRDGEALVLRNSFSVDSNCVVQAWGVAAPTPGLANTGPLGAQTWLWGAAIVVAGVLLSTVAVRRQTRPVL
jgi:hypothetical protein